ncbi:hypothetical protein GGI43DRAFT_386228 [Trichoderma evansii]
MSSVANLAAGKRAALILRGELGADKVILPDDAHPDLGKYGTDFYFIAQSSQIIPACRIVREVGATFAVKSGGHCSYASGINAEDGITIDLSRLKDITVSDDRKSVAVGAGCRFGEVYNKLEAHGLGCVGGRISSVGVSGLIMGGGISFFSSERGLACDNVISYELVLANGKVLNVTKESQSDLFWGMRGAGITFGIVTRLELKPFDLGEIWGGNNPFAEAFLIYSDEAKNGNGVYVVVMSHSNPQSETLAFDDFKRFTPLFSSNQKRTLKNFCDEMDSQNESGFRFRTTSMSVKCHLPTLKEIAAIHDESVALLKDYDGFVPTLLYQPLLKAMLPKDDVGNALGIKPEDTPLLGIPEMISQVVDQFVEKVEKATRAHGTFHRYQYLNYAAGHQDVYGGYGEKNKKRLLEISSKYDPDGLMPKLRPGIIQLSGSKKAYGISV